MLRKPASASPSSSNSAPAWRSRSSVSPIPGAVAYAAVGRSAVANAGCPAKGVTSIAFVSPRKGVHARRVGPTCPWQGDSTSGSSTRRGSASTSPARTGSPDRKRGTTPSPIGTSSGPGGIQNPCAGVARSAVGVWRVSCVFDVAGITKRESIGRVARPRDYLWRKDSQRELHDTSHHRNTGREISSRWGEKLRSGAGGQTWIGVQHRTAPDGAADCSHGCGSRKANATRGQRFSFFQIPRRGNGGVRLRRAHAARSAAELSGAEFNCQTHRTTVSALPWRASHHPW